MGCTKPVVCIDGDGKLAEYSSAKEAACSLGVNLTGVRDCLRGARVSVGEYRFKYGTISDADNLREWRDKEKTVSLCRKSIPVVVFNPDTTLVGYYDSIRGAATALGISPSAMSSCVAGKNNTVGGYVVRACTKKEFKNKSAVYKVPEKHGKDFPIVQVTCNNEEVAVFKNTNEAANASKRYERTGISKCCNHKLKTAYGFKWFYLDEWLFHNKDVPCGRT